MRLDALLEGLEGLDVTGNPDCEVARLAYDSRRVEPGDLFFALPGLRHDGSAFARDAFARGAAAVVTGEALDLPGRTLVRAPDPRRAMAEIACRLNGYPSRSLRVAGVTGTNGKTTTTYLLADVFRRAGWTPGLVGTTGVLLGDERRASAFTTPEAPELQGLLRDMVGRGVQAAAVEVSSHALAQWRSFGLECDVAVFTNLSHDHLDYHGTLERYLDAKLMLFDGRNSPRRAKPFHAAVNADDAQSPCVAAAARRGGARLWTFGRAAGATIEIRRVEAHVAGLDIVLAEGGRELVVRLALLGRYNAWNAAAAFAAARALGVSAADAAAGMAAVTAVPGRLERVAAGLPYEVVVDYAHTPDALAQALAAVREHGRGRVLLVFGAGGDRDRAKRPLMGAVAGRGADAAWITSDNPRGEDAAAIAAEIAAGMTGTPRIVLDRRAAIAAAVGEARDGDVVLVAGKGHETTQTIGDRVLPFDDRAVAREILGLRAGARG